MQLADQVDDLPPYGNTGMDLGPLDDTFGYLLRRAWRDVARSFNHHFRSIGITSAQFAIMILIDRNPGCTPGDLVAPIGISQNNLVGIVGDLIVRGFVRKGTTAADRRVRTLTITGEGREMMAAAQQAHAAYEAEFRERIGAENLRDLTRILRMFDRG